MNTIVLASSSPRRREILTQMGLSFTVVAPNIDETTSANLPPDELAVTLAREKGKAASQNGHIHRPDGAAPLLLAADTVVAYDGNAIGKPRSRTEAQQFLSSLSGRSHHVHTGVSLWRGCEIASDRETTEVRFAELSPAEIEWYLDTEEWRDVAGGYRIQGRGACLIEAIVGSYSNVVGLPIRLVYSMLTANGFDLS